MRTLTVSAVCRSRPAARPIATTLADIAVIATMDPTALALALTLVASASRIAEHTPLR